MALIRYVIICLVLSGYSCSPVQHISKASVSYEIIHDRRDLVSDSSIVGMIAPYKVQLDEKMNEVLGNVSQGLTKQKPESTLGNWYTDAMVSAAKKAGYNVDFAISNYGGLRVPEITKGPLTRGEIYELCPFDNMMVIMDLKGNYVDSLFQQIAATEGWPISEGVWMVIQNKKMINCTIHSLLLDPSLTYKVAMPDYVANGGDGLKVLIPLPRTQTGLLVREILMAYAQETALAGKEITATIQGRIVIQL